MQQVATHIAKVYRLGPFFGHSRLTCCVSCLQFEALRQEAVRLVAQEQAAQQELEAADEHAQWAGKQVSSSNGSASTDG